MADSLTDALCVGCEIAPAAEDGFCTECAEWCKAFFRKLFPEDNE